MSTGTIVQCIGAVVDIKFPREQMPKVYNALKLEKSGESFAEDGLTFEVQQQLGDGVVHFYFATGSAELPEEAPLALAEVVKGVATGQRAIISGWHDATGGTAQNAALAKERAEAVQHMLAELGVGAEHVELRRPDNPQGSGAEARRVDVWLE